MEILQWIADVFFREIVPFFTVRTCYIVLSLVALEALLSADNALVLGMMAGELPKRQQKKALTYGMWGAFGFRILAIIFAVWLIGLWYVKLAGGIYLLYIAVDGLRKNDAAAQSSLIERAFAKIFSNKSQGAFWLTIAQIELMDLAFSVDSILAALGMVEGSTVAPEHIKVIVVLGGILGIITMRLVAMQVIKFLAKYPTFKKTAYVLVFIIGFKLVVGIFWHPPEWLTYTLLLSIVVASYLYERFGKQIQNRLR